MCVHRYLWWDCKTLPQSRPCLESPPSARRAGSVPPLPPSGCHIHSQTWSDLYLSSLGWGHLAQNAHMGAALFIMFLIVVMHDPRDKKLETQLESDERRTGLVYQSVKEPINQILFKEPNKSRSHCLSGLYKLHSERQPLSLDPRFEWKNLPYWGEKNF